MTPLIEEGLSEAEQKLVEDLLDADASEEERERLRAGMLRDNHEMERIHDALTRVAEEAIERVRTRERGFVDAAVERTKTENPDARMTTSANILVGVAVLRWAMSYTLKTLNLSPELLVDATKNVVRGLIRAKRERS